MEFVLNQEAQATAFEKTSKTICKNLRLRRYLAQDGGDSTKEQGDA